MVAPPKLTGDSFRRPLSTLQTYWRYPSHPTGDFFRNLLRITSESHLGFSWILNGDSLSKPFWKLSVNPTEDSLRISLEILSELRSMHITKAFLDFFRILLEILLKSHWKFSLNLIEDSLQMSLKIHSRFYWGFFPNLTLRITLKFFLTGETLRILMEILYETFWKLRPNRNGYSHRIPVQIHSESHWRCFPNAVHRISPQTSMEIFSESQWRFSPNATEDSLRITLENLSKSHSPHPTNDFLQISMELLSKSNWKFSRNLLEILLESHWRLPLNPTRDSFRISMEMLFESRSPLITGDSLIIPLEIHSQTCLEFSPNPAGDSLQITLQIFFESQWRFSLLEILFECH